MALKRGQESVRRALRVVRLGPSPSGGRSEARDARSLDAQPLDGLLALEDLDRELGVVLRARIMSGELERTSATAPRWGRAGGGGGGGGAHLFNLEDLGLELLVLLAVLGVVCAGGPVSTRSGREGEARRTTHRSGSRRCRRRLWALVRRAWRGLMRGLER